MNFKFHIIVISLALLSIGIYLFFNTTDQYEIKPNIDSIDLQLGKELYQQNCASCHGQDLQGEPNWQQRKASGILPAPPHDKTGHTWHHNDEYLFAYTKYGGLGYSQSIAMKDWQSGMPSFENTLTDDEIWQILNYIKSQWPIQIREIQESRN